MPETTTERLVALVGLVAALLLLIIAFSARTREDVVPVAAPSARQTNGDGSTPTSAQPSASAYAPRPASRPAADAPLLVLRAARGDCWLSARRGSADGELLYEGTLLSGRSLRLDGVRLWLRFGAAANVDLTLNGKKFAALPPGTGDVVATARGIQPAV